MRYWPLLLALIGCAEPVRLANSDIGPWPVEPKSVHHATVEMPIAVVEERSKPLLPRAPPAAPVDTVQLPVEAAPSTRSAPPLSPRRRLVARPRERATTLPPPPRSPAIEVAATVGGGGLAVAAVGAAVALEDPNPGSLVLSGLGLGIGVVGLATAGVLALMDQDEDKSAVRVEPSGLGLTVRF